MSAAALTGCSAGATISEVVEVDETDTMGASDSSGMVMEYSTGNALGDTGSPPPSVGFAENLSAYGLFEGDLAALVPAADTELLELSSSLFVNYADKQRLVRLPEGTEMEAQGSGLPRFPEGTLLTKTFYYPNDRRDPSSGRRIIETRLLILQQGEWIAGSYIWNDAQTDATLELAGYDTDVSWIDARGNNRTIRYHVPDEEECITCHRGGGSTIPLGPELRNMNALVVRNGASLNQLDHLQSMGMLSAVDPASVQTVPNYEDPSVPLDQRGRAYIDANCAHCHHPGGYPKAAEKGFDFRYETPFSNTRIQQERDDIVETMREREMPYLGTSTLDREGLTLVESYVSGL